MTSSRMTYLRKRGAHWLLLFILAGTFKYVVCETVETCASEDLQISCSRNQIILMKSAEYGRMEVGRCIKKEDEFMGCRNDVISLLDKWCSGRQECSVRVSNEDLDEANANCLEILRQYLKVEYECIEVLKCSANRPNFKVAEEGFISSISVDEKRCGTPRSPWMISSKPGQTIHLDMIDFGIPLQGSSFLSCSAVYGYILEKALGINYTICSGKERHMSLYTSKTNSIELVLLPRERRSGSNFLIRYRIVGCPELTHSARVWYKREGNEAVIGCENNNNEWRLVCIDNRWRGEVGNCTETVSVSKPKVTEEKTLSISSVVVISGIAGLAIVLSVIAIVSGVVYINKYRMRQEVKRAQLYKTYSTLDRNVQAYYQPASLGRPTDTGTCSDTVLAPDPSRPFIPVPDQCICPTLQLRTVDNTNPATGGSSLETQSLYNSIKST